MEAPGSSGQYREQNPILHCPDKNPAQMRKEVLTKRLLSVLGPLAIEKQFFAKKSLGSIYCDGRVVVSVQITGEETARLLWCHAKRIELKIDQATVEEEFAHYTVAGGPRS